IISVCMKSVALNRSGDPRRDGERALAQQRWLPHIPPTARSLSRLMTEFMDDVAQPLLDFIQTHSDWAALVMFVTAFGESFAFISLLFPGTTVLIAAGTLLAAGTLPYASVLVGAVLGAVLGEFGDRLIGSANTVLLVFGGLTLIWIGGAVWATLRTARPKP